MALRWNDAERRLTLSVHDAIEVGPPAGGLRPRMVASRARLAAGQKAHVEWQAWRAEEDEAFQAEVAVQVSVMVREWEVVIRGRIDGLTQEDGFLVVEELKSSALDQDQLSRTELHDWAGYEAQVALYRFLLHSMGLGEAIGRLVLVSLVDASRVVFLVDEPLSETESWLRQRLEWAVQRREELNAWLAKRRASDVPFPHPTVRTGQAAIVEAAQDGVARGRHLLLSAPTGTGKTAAVLQGVLREAYRRDQRVFIATAKGTQQRIAEKTLAALKAQGLPLRAVSIRAREKACVNDIVDCRPEGCRYADGYFDRVQPVVRELLDQGVSRPEELRKLGQERHVCPFELALDLSDHADVIVGDYNYVFHPRSTLRRHFGPEHDQKRWVVVVDEAHNLPERAKDHHSPELRAEDAELALLTLTAEDPAMFDAYIAVARDALRAIEETELLVEPGARTSRDRQAAVVELVHRTWFDLRDRVDELAFDYGQLRRLRPVDDDDLYMDLSRAIQDFAAVLDQWRAHGQGEEIASIVKRVHGRVVVKLVCLDPSPWLRPRFEALGAAVLMSATLSPSRFYTDLCGLDPERVEVSDHPSPFPPENLEVLLAHRIRTTYRDREAHAERTAALIREVIQATPGNVAVFYSAFSMLRSLAPACEVERTEALMQEPRMKEDQRLALVDQLRGLGPKRVLHAVLGGIFSEGIDLPGGMLKTAIIVGPSLPMVGLERDLARDWYDTRYGDGFGYAFLVPGMSRVVQAAGRLVRGPDDRGCVVLVGRRFGWTDYATFFPDTWDTSRPQDVAAEVERFFAV